MTKEQITIEDLRRCIGEELGVSDWIDVPQARIDAFAECTEDKQWIHVDVNRAQRESLFGGTVAHGFLTLSLLPKTGYELLVSRLRARAAVNYGLEKVRFIEPVRAGGRVRNRMKVLAIESKVNGSVLLTIENSMELDGAKRPAFVATTLMLVHET